MRLRQPDRRSCGAASLVMARRAVEPRYAERVGDQAVFAREVATLHRRITSMVDTAGGLQLPWLRAIGTPPWATARELRLITGVEYGVHPVLRGAEAWRRLSVARESRPVAVYIGNLVAPRHVVLALAVTDEAAWTYEPSSGRVVLVSRARWEEGPLGLGGWHRTWFVVSPSSEVTTAP